MDKRKHYCEKLVIAVVAKEIVEDLNHIADKVIVLYTPEPFGAIGCFYQDLLKLMTMK